LLRTHSALAECRGRDEAAHEQREKRGERDGSRATN
jgi:hypothetical protein